VTVQHRLFDPYAADRAADARRRRRLPVSDVEQLVLDLLHASGGETTGRRLLALALDAVTSLSARRAVTTDGDVIRLAA
jgi:hypothetical protein